MANDIVESIRALQVYVSDFYTSFPYIANSWYNLPSNSRTAQSKFKPRLVASTELHKNEHTYQVWPSKPILKDKHPQKLLEEPVHAVVSLLIVLYTDLCDVNLQGIFAEY